MATSMQLDPAMLNRLGAARDTARGVQPSASAAAMDAVPYYHQISTRARGGKRALDLVFSVVALALSGVALPAIALAIRLESRGPVFYSQVRVGINRRTCGLPHERDIRSDGPVGRTDRRQGTPDQRRVVAAGRPFTIYKLRTMYANSERDGIRWAQKDDQRITHVGRLLRLSRLDEFPQFYNVLKGDMSIIGPRPERPPFISMLCGAVPGYLDRLRFKPGITGLAQVANGYDQSLDSVHRKVELDLEYMSTFSLLNDLKILARTVRVVLTGEGAC